jgi:hypothetical protein
MAESGYRSAPGLLKYGLVGRAIITTAIASPASNDKTSIVLTHLRVRTLVVDFQQRAITDRFYFAPLTHLLIASNVRAATRASVEEVFQERSGK